MPVPLPQVDPGANPVPFDACTGRVQLVTSLSPSATASYAVITLCPYAQYPVAIMKGANPGANPLVDLAALVNLAMDFNTNIDDDTRPLTGTVTDVPWQSGQDPRSMITGQVGPNGKDFDPLDNTPLATTPLIQQFMGGRFELDVSASYNATGTVSVLDEKSFPTAWGSRLPSSNMVDDDTTFENIPDPQDFINIYRAPAIVAGTSIEAVAAVGAQQQVVGSSESSTICVKGLVPPGGQKWALWSGCNTTTPGAPGPTKGTGYAGGCAANNWFMRLSQGYPLIIIMMPADPTGTSGTLSITLKAFFAYNVTIPTTSPSSLGGAGIALLAQSAPTTTPHSTPVQKIHAVITPYVKGSQPIDGAMTVRRTQLAGLPVEPAHHAGVQPVHMTFAEKAKSVASDIFGHAFDILKALGKKVVTKGVSKLEEKAEAALFAE